MRNSIVFLNQSLLAVRKFPSSERDLCDSPRAQRTFMPDSGFSLTLKPNGFESQEP